MKFMCGHSLFGWTSSGLAPAGVFVSFAAGLPIFGGRPDLRKVFFMAQLTLLGTNKGKF